MKSIKKVSGTLKLELAQYRSLEAFAMFASDLDAASRRQLARGARLTELLKQPQYSPYPVEEQVVSIWAGTKGKLDTIPVEDVLRFERELHRPPRPQHRRAHDPPRDERPRRRHRGRAREGRRRVRHRVPGRQRLAAPGAEKFDAIDEDEIQQEKIVKQKR